MENKFCVQCEIIKPLSEFHKDKARYDGVTVYCKQCEGIRNKKRYYKNIEKEHLRSKRWREQNLEKNRIRCKRWAKNHLEKVKQIRKRFYQEHKKEIIARAMKRKLRRRKEILEILGGKCCKCGYDKCLCSLDFHHVKGEKEYWCDWMKKDYDLSQLILLCANCHREIHHGCNGGER